MKSRYCVMVEWDGAAVEVCATDDRQQAEWARQFWNTFGFAADMIGW